ncbi:DNA adenine methylase [Pseudomonas carnis]|uniref:DNA adenine methylase n=1 Tax=Pseudomonas carnis TaxID=2487355 RepID=UPI001DB24F2E|nr:DNA adenine methylase [Pseudomonas carnis]CAH0195065.1 Modification methylase FokI [Pseudomonas carnis]CAH0245441.1 Modification methylase FokI [Pseudomonas carnis]CAH0299715.1 Modification methylase FokI [Pseudomonas carnis]CAH0305085.1 Modification methylase FokI [Pseudomonas carnis]
MFRYFGSKASTAPVVADIALDGYKNATVADAFGGLGNIGAEFKKRGCLVTACDLLHFPNAFQHVRLVCDGLPNFSRVRKLLSVSSQEGLLIHLNSLCSDESWFVKEYAEVRGFFTAENAAKISAVWLEIKSWKTLELIDVDEEKFLIASLLNSMDAVANTAGTYYAYLKKWDRKALKTFSFEWYLGFVEGPRGVAIRGDALNYLSDKKFEVLYLDPPYNGRDYSRYYHLPETLAKFEEVSVDSNSKCGQPVVRSTMGSQIRNAMRLPYLLDLINSVSWERLVVQYADGAHICLNELERALVTQGTLKVHEIPALGYQSTNGTRQQMHHVFIINK